MNLVLYVVGMGRIWSTNGRDKNAYKMSGGNPDRKRQLDRLTV
jgi:hypothetical protein